MELEIGKLRGKCACGQEHALAVRGIWIEPGALKRLPSVLAENGWKRPALLCDQNTWEAAGREAAGLLPDAAAAVLEPAGLHADEHGVGLAREALPDGADVLLAVGAGTLHDITRFVAYERSVSFVSVPTAASVDGFVSTVAAMTWQGCKKTMPAAAPLYVLADSDVFAAAPRRLTASGAADLLGKYTALADWRIAHLVTGEPLCERVCGLELQAVERVCSRLPLIASGGREGCEELMYGLLLSGLAMQMVGNSRPASGAEHHLSHLWEMEVLNPWLDVYHGEKVGVGLLLAARAYHRFADALREGRLKPAPWGGDDLSTLRKRFAKPGMAALLLEENTPDPLAGLDGEALLARREELLAVLDELPSEETLAGCLAQAGAPVALEQLGLSEDLRERSLALAPYVRRRLTLLRLFWLFEPGWEN